MPTDRDTLARDLLTLPALVGAPGEVVRGLVLRAPADAVFPQAVDFVDANGRWIMPRADGHPLKLHAAGWRVDLDAQATAGVLVDLLHLEWGCVAVWSNPDGDWYVARDPLMCAAVDAEVYTAPTLAEAGARALVEVARGC